MGTPTGLQAGAWLEDAQGRQIPVRGSCSLGRSASNQVAVPDERVSRRHAAIQAQGENEFWLVDFGSRNGTYLNGRRISHPVRLRHGDRLRLGVFEFRFHQPASAGGVAAATVMATRTVTEILSATCWLLVADIVDSSRLVAELPPDELPRVTGEWLAECKWTIEASGGRINQFLGDGFFAFWRDRNHIEGALEEALQALSRLQEQRRPPFRLALHCGTLVIGGTALGEEERLSGVEVHFVFRMEKLAAGLGEGRLLSEPAWRRLGPLLDARDIGRHALHGFEGLHRFFAF